MGASVKLSIILLSLCPSVPFSPIRVLLSKLGRLQSRFRHPRLMRVTC